MSSSSILSFWKIIVGRDARRPTRSLPCLSFHLNAARRPARFAPACPQSQRTRFSSANRGPENPEKGARRQARFAPVCPQSQRIRFSSANPGDAQNSKTHPTRRRSPPVRQRPPTLAEPHRPGSAPVKRRLKVKFKLTIQSENLRFNSKCFYHSKSD